MKKLISMLLIGSLALSITACGGKKEEPKSENVSTAQITEAQTALSSEPEVPAEPEYTCKTEMYEADWDDGLVQINDIVFDAKEKLTIGEIADIFSDTRYQLTIIRSGGTQEDPYNSGALITAGETISLKIKENNNELCFFDASNTSAEIIPVKDCYFTRIASTLYQAPSFWVATGIEPFNLTHDSIEETIQSNDLVYKENWMGYELKTTDTSLETHYIWLIDISTGGISRFDFSFTKQ